MDNRKKILLIVVCIVAVTGIFLGKMSQQAANKKSVKLKEAATPVVEAIPAAEKKVENDIPASENSAMVEKELHEEELQKAKYKELAAERKLQYVDKLSPESQEAAREREKEVVKASEDFVKQKRKEIQERIEALSKRSSAQN